MGLVTFQGQQFQTTPKKCRHGMTADPKTSFLAIMQQSALEQKTSVAERNADSHGGYDSLAAVAQLSKHRFPSCICTALTPTQRSMAQCGTAHAH